MRIVLYLSLAAVVELGVAVVFIAADRPRGRRRTRKAYEGRRRLGNEDSIPLPMLRSARPPLSCGHPDDGQAIESCLGCDKLACLQCRIPIHACLPEMESADV